MNSQVVISIIALVTALGTAAFTALGQSRLRKEEEERRRHATIDRYREPFMQSVFNLQSRLWNIATKGPRFRDAYRSEPTMVGDESASGEEDAIKATYAVTSTMWLVGEYLCWVEILRREVQFLHSSTQVDQGQVAEAIATITSILADDRFGPELKIFRSHQRALGELMMVRVTDGSGVKRTGCMGFAEFTSRLEDPPFARWFHSLKSDVERLPDGYARGISPGRLIALQGALVDLLMRIDVPSRSGRKGHRERRFREDMCTKLARPSAHLGLNEEG